MESRSESYMQQLVKLTVSWDNIPRTSHEMKCEVEGIARFSIFVRTADSYLYKTFETYGIGCPGKPIIGSEMSKAVWQDLIPIGLSLLFWFA